MGVYENVVKVFGPYRSKKDLRLRVVLENIDGSTYVETLKRRKGKLKSLNTA